MAKWFYSPSGQDGNGSHGYLEEKWCNLLTDDIIPIMERHGEECNRNNPDQKFKAHTIAANLWGADFDVPLHSNAIMPDGNTWQTTHSGPTVGCSSPALLTAKGTILSQLIYDRLYELWLPPTRRKLVKYNFYEVTETLMPVAYVENFYHDNEKDQKFGIDNRKKIAIQICKGCLQMVGKTYDRLEEIQPMYRIQAGYQWRNKVYADAYLKKLQDAGFVGKISETME